MANIQKGICKNYDECDKADQKEVQERKSGEQFVCEECGKPLVGSATAKNSSPTKFIIIAAVAALLIGGGVFVVLQKDTLFPSNEVTIEQPQPEDPTPPQPEPVAEPEPESPEPEELKADTKPVNPEPTPSTSVKNGRGTLDLGYAIYTGDIKNGKPHGNGTLEYKRSQKIVSNKDYVASPGEQVIGMFRDGSLNTGTWYQKDGNQVVIKK